LSALSGLVRDLGSIAAKRWLRAARHSYARLRWGDDLPALARYFGTDKWGAHWYAQHYQTHFAPLRRKPLRLLEIGIGGYDDPRRGGESLRMWKAYFPSAQIVGIDLADKRVHDETRIRTVVGSQADGAFLHRLNGEAGPFDIVIDDGSHHNEHVIRAFQTLFPLLSEDGIYVVEDTQTAYWPDFGGAPAGEGARTSMNFLKSLVDGLNHREFPDRPEPDYFQGHVVAAHFYHNLVFIKKGLNDEPSNVLDALVARPDVRAPR
jgi:demethylmacrocin O-methyltransferase